MRMRLRIPALLIWLAAAMAASSLHAADLLRQELQQEGIGLQVRLQTDDANARHAGIGDTLRLSVSATRLADGQPLPNLPIGAWLDHSVSVMSGVRPSCGQRVAAILGGGLLQRPVLDLTGYYVLTLDAEGSVSVLDPAVSMAGRSSLYTAVQLGGRGFDWVATDDDRWLFVAVPDRQQVVVIDLQSFAIRQRIAVAGKPTRLALSLDGGALWVAQRAEQEGESDRVDAFAVNDGHAIGGAALPRGHHEIVFGEAGRVFVSSRDAGTVSVFDAAAQRLREVELGGEPLALLALPNNGGLWAVDGRSGAVHRLSAQGEQIDRIALESGLGPARLTPDGRFVLIVSPAQHRLYVLDAHTGALRHRLTISGRPYDVFLSRRFAYIRTLDTGSVALLELAGLNATPTLQSLPLGEIGIGDTPGLPIASSMSRNRESAGVFMVSPGERTIYHYMEGMNAPDSGLRTYGHTPLAVRISQRGLRQTGPGDYTTTFRLPAQGKMVLALAVDSPRIRQCLDVAFTGEGEDEGKRSWSLRWLSEPPLPVKPGASVEYLLELSAPAGTPLPQAQQLLARIVPGAGGGASQEWPLQPAGQPGQYRLRAVAGEVGGYFVHVLAPGVPSATGTLVPAALIVR